MSCRFFRLLALIWSFQDLVSGFQNHRIRSRPLTGTTSIAASTVGRAEWIDDESLAGSRDASPKRKLNATFIDNLVISKIPYSHVPNHMCISFPLPHDIFFTFARRTLDLIFHTYYFRMVPLDLLSLDVL